VFRWIVSVTANALLRLSKLWFTLVQLLELLKKSSVIVIGSSYTASILNIFNFLIFQTLWLKQIKSCLVLITGQEQKKSVTFFLSFRVNRSTVLQKMHGIMMFAL